MNKKKAESFYKKGDTVYVFDTRGLNAWATLRKFRVIGELIERKSVLCEHSDGNIIEVSPLCLYSTKKKAVTEIIEWIRSGNMERYTDNIINREIEELRTTVYHYENEAIKLAARVSVLETVEDTTRNKWIRILVNKWIQKAKLTKRKK